MSRQEKGMKAANALPYELYTGGKLSDDKKHFEIQFKAGNQFFGQRAAGSPFTVYVGGNFRSVGNSQAFEAGRIWSYAVKAGETLSDQWSLNDFENGLYHLKVCGPNGFLREFKGSAKDAKIDVQCNYETGRTNKKSASGNISVVLQNSGPTVTVEIIDNAYKAKTITRALASGQRENVIINLQRSYAWYDFTLRVKGENDFERRFAGKVETGVAGFTDPLMGRMV